MERSFKRDAKTLRPVKFTRNFTINAYSSVLSEFGNTKVICSVSLEPGRPKWMDKEDERGWITAEYSLLPSSTQTRVARERSKVSGRTHEIQRLIGRSLRSCVELEKLGNYTLTIDADVIQADGGTRCASICGAYVALEEAVKKMIAEGLIESSPITDKMAAVSVGIVNGEILLDLDYSEDSTAQVDANVVMTKSGKIIEFQTTAEGFPFEKGKLYEMLELAQSGINTIISKY